MKKNKRITSFRLSERVKVFLSAIAETEDMSMTAVLESLVKEDAKKRKMDYESLKDKYGIGDL